MSTLADQIIAAVAADPHLKDFDVVVKVSARRKQMGWVVKAGGGPVELNVPASYDVARVMESVGRNRARIVATVVRARQLAPVVPPLVLRGGATVQWLGSPMRLRLVAGYGRAFRDDEVSGPVLAVPRGSVALHGAAPVIEWYARAGTAWAVAEAVEWWPRLSSGPAPAVEVASMGYGRWGKYDGRKNLATVGWHSMQLPEDLARHVLLHELSHAAVRGRSRTPHGPQFWAAFERVQPSARMDQRRLDRDGSVWHGDIAPATA